jgi:G:T-mismatch repair DNA endonuclease (very short patch repair protein)
LRGNKIKIDNRTFKPDALNVETLTIYEFYGDFWHGNPRRFDPNDINFAVKKTYGELYRLTMDREESLKQAGYNIVSIWESDWKKINEQACLQKNITASR